MRNKYIIVLTTILAICCATFSFGQSSVAKETKILEQQLNLFSAANKKQAGNEKIEFDGCSCKYTNTAADKDGFSMSKSNEFDLKEISSVNYTRTDNNSYELRIKLKTEDNAVTQVLDLSSININLYTSDEKQVKDITTRFKKAVKACESK